MIDETCTTLAHSTLTEGVDVSCTCLNWKLDGFHSIPINSPGCIFPLYLKNTCQKSSSHWYGPLTTSLAQTDYIPYLFVYTLPLVLSAQQNPQCSINRYRVSNTNKHSRSRFNTLHTEFTLSSTETYNSLESYLCIIEQISLSTVKSGSVDYFKYVKCVYITIARVYVYY